MAQGVTTLPRWHRCDGTLENVPRLIALLVALGACGVELDDRPGRACDETHPCRTGRACVLSACVDPGSMDDGGGDAGLDAGADAGIDAGVDAGVDAGLIGWEQRVHGFSARTEAPGCSVDIDPNLGNRVLASVRPGPDAGDLATADLTDARRLPTTAEGHLRGRLTLSTKLALRGRTPLVRLGADSQPWFDLGFTTSSVLFVSSAAGTLAQTELTETYARDGGFGPGDVVVDVAWRRGGFRTLRVDGVLVANTPLSTAGSAAPPPALRLGVVQLGGDGGAFEVTLSGFQLADRADASLGDP